MSKALCKLCFPSTNTWFLFFSWLQIPQSSPSSSSPFFHQLTPVNFFPSIHRNWWSKLLPTASCKFNSQYSLLKIVNHFSSWHVFFTGNPEPHISSLSPFPSQSPLLVPLLSYLWSIFGCVLFSFHTHSLGAVSQLHDFKCTTCWWQPKCISPARIPLLDFRLICTSTYLKSLLDTYRHLKLIMSKSELLLSHGYPPCPPVLLTSVNNSSILLVDWDQNWGIIVDSFSQMYVWSISNFCPFYVQNISRT